MIEAATASAMPSSTPKITTAAVVSRAMVNSRRRQARMRRIPPTSMSPMAMRKTIAAKAARGRLAAPARAVGHLRLGRAAVDDEGARQRGGHVGGTQADQVGVLAECLLMPPGVGA